MSDDIDRCNALIAALDACKNPSLRWAVALEWLEQDRVDMRAQINKLKRELKLFKVAPDGAPALRKIVDRQDKRIERQSKIIGELHRRLKRHRVPRSNEPDAVNASSTE